ncbi:hypothetical protein BDK51DRAFT_33737 [Blyttiomyces helicus]|uniref:Bulb-type lectin domain-containing protein n=1 Tax=Blyttiomyces helicus TaxID=388810 RepID=A0A4P9WFG7_9FUNG|nr:hypothetical protein BDK51DRAFT_33737 [Blyttiomyces helicus]|eukprot:RKO91152.1 hypothetical protein BDK51DRAFT_33737 [Blyttiomyces helicus]
MLSAGIVAKVTLLVTVFSKFNCYQFFQSPLSAPVMSSEAKALAARAVTTLYNQLAQHCDYEGVGSGRLTGGIAASDLQGRLEGAGMTEDNVIAWGEYVPLYDQVRMVMVEVTQVVNSAITRTELKRRELPILHAGGFFRRHGNSTKFTKPFSTNHTLTGNATKLVFNNDTSTLSKETRDEVLRHITANARSDGTFDRFDRQSSIHKSLLEASLDQWGGGPDNCIQTETIWPCQDISIGLDLVSESGNNHLSMQADGNLVSYGMSSSVWHATWASQTWGKGVRPYSAIFQWDSNFAVYDANAEVLWSSHTTCLGTVRMQDDGNLVVYCDGRCSNPIWSSGVASKDEGGGGVEAEADLGPREGAWSEKSSLPTASRAPERRSYSTRSKSRLPGVAASPWSERSRYRRGSSAKSNEKALNAPEVKVSRRVSLIARRRWRKRGQDDYCFGVIVKMPQSCT